MKLKILTIALSIVFLSGCALTTEQVNLNYQPSHKPIRKTSIATPALLNNSNLATTSSGDDK